MTYHSISHQPPNSSDGANTHPHPTITCNPNKTQHRQTPPPPPTPPAQPEKFNHHPSSIHGFSPRPPYDGQEMYASDNISVCARFSANLIVPAIQKAKTILRDETFRHNARTWMIHRHTIRCTACRRTPNQNQTSLTTPENQPFKSSWFEKATTDPNLLIILCPQCMFDSPWVAASKHEVHITAPTFSNGWSTTDAQWKAQKSLLTKNTLVSHILNLENPPLDIITVDHLLKQAQRPIYGVNLEPYRADIARALTDRQMTEKPKPSNKRILRQLNNEQHEKRTKLLTPSPRKHRKGKKHNAPKTSNVNATDFVVAARTIIHDAAAEIYHHHHHHTYTDKRTPR